MARSKRPQPAPPTASSAGLTGLDKLLALATVVAAFLAYLPSLKGGLLWGDVEDLVSKPDQLAASGLFRAWTDPLYRQQFYPVTHTVFWLAAHLWGGAPTPYRVLVLALHVATALLLGLVLKRLGVRGAFVAALLFALHPLNAGTAAWISKLTNTLSSVLALGSLLLLLLLIPQDPEAPPGALTSRRAWLTYAGGFVLFALALLAKTAVAPLPVVLLLIAWWKRGRLEKEIVWLAVPLVVVATGLGLITSKLEGVLYPLDARSFSWTPLDRLLIAGNAVAFYLRKLLLPTGLSFVYPRWDLAHPTALQWAAVLLAVVLPALLFSLRERLGRGPAAAVLMAYALLFPALGFFKVWYMRFSFVADHWAYWAYMALIPLGVSAAATLLDRAPRPAAIGLAAAAAGALGFATWHRAPLFTSEETAWTHALSLAPHSALAETNLGWEYAKQERFDDALAMFERGLKDHPDDAPLLLDEGFCLMRTGRYQEAVVSLEHALDQPDIDLRTLQKTRKVLDTARALRDAPDDERQQWIDKANEYVEAKQAKGP